MLERITSQETVTLIEATKYFPNCPHVNTLRRWAHKGLNGVRLKTFRSGRRMCTTRQYVEDFLSGCTRQFDGDQEPTPQNHRSAEQELDALGI